MALLNKIYRINNNKSLLDRNQSTWLKGVLILLIVLGHNAILMGNLPGMETRPIYHFLYCFHVQSFFFITSLYNWPIITKEYVKKIFSRLYKPYTALFLVVFIANLLITRGQTLSWGGVIVSYISGSDLLIKKSIGMSFLWFLPTMFSFLLILGSSRNESPKYLRILLWLLSFGILALSACGLLRYGYSKWSIAGSYVALRAFALCFLNRAIFEQLGRNRAYQYVVYGTAVLAVILFFTIYGQNYIVDSLLKFILVPSSMFQLLAVLVYQKKNYNSVILYLGRHSLQIYLFHQLFFNVILVGLQKMDIQLNMVIGVIVYIGTLIVTVLFDMLFKKMTPIIYDFLYSIKR